MQILALRELKRNIKCYEASEELVLSDEFKEAFLGVLLDTDIDMALKALTLTLPDLTYIGEQYSQMNVDAIYHVHRWLKNQLAGLFKTELKAIYQPLATIEKAYVYSSTDIAERKLKNVCLSYLTHLDDGIGLAETQYRIGGNMTDVLAALDALSHTDSQARETLSLIHI